MKRLPELFLDHTGAGRAVAMVLLPSCNEEHPYDLTVEIHTAIALHRRFPDEDRAVAVFLDGRHPDPMQMPGVLHPCAAWMRLPRRACDAVPT